MFGSEDFDLDDFVSYDGADKISPDLLNNDAFMRAVFLKVGYFYTPSTELRADKSFVLFAIGEQLNRHGRSVFNSMLQDFSTDLRDDTAVVALAIWHNPFDFQFASKRRRNEPETFRDAIASFCTLSLQDPALARHRNYHCRTRSFVLSAGYEIRNSEVLVSRAIEEISPHELRGASHPVRNRPAVCLKAVLLDGCALEHCSESRRDDEAIVMAAVGQKPTALLFASQRLQRDPNIAKHAINAAIAADEDWRETVLPHVAESLRSLLEQVCAWGVGIGVARWN